MKAVFCVKSCSSKLIDVYSTEKIMMNPYDLYAINQIVRMKNIKNLEIICMCMGNSEAKNILQKCLELGADRGILLCDTEFSGADTVATSKVLATAIEQMGDVDYVITGCKAVDGETGQIGYALAARLGMHVIEGVYEVQEESEKEIICTVKNAESIITLKLKKHSVLIFDGVLTKKPIVPLVQIKKARKKKIDIYSMIDIGLSKGECGVEGSKTKVLSSENVIEQKIIKEIEGERFEKVQFIHNMIERVMDDKS